MLLRILTLTCCCFIYATHSGPVLTKIDEYSNDLTENENTDSVMYTVEDKSESEGIVIGDFEDDVDNLETISPKPSAPSKRMIGDAEGDVKTPNATIGDSLMSYVSKNIEAEVPNANLTDAEDVQKVVGAVLKLYGQFFEGKGVTYKSVSQEEGMMSDQPMNDEASGFKKIVVPTFDEAPTARSHDVSSSERPTSVTTRDDALTKEIRMMTKEIYRNAFRHRLLANINRPLSPVPSFPNLTIPFPAQTLANGSDSPYMEKIRSFYPTCDIPKNTKDAWKEENLLNLFFNVDYDQNVTIATATLRLHRLPANNQTGSFWGSDICPENAIFEDEKLIRVSIYWYIKSSKKHSKVKRRLCDSKMVNENAQWVELSVKAATKTWTKSGKNMGLAVLVEDQDGGMLKASKYFKGATCTVGTIGTPTPRPIPTLITDSAKQTNDSQGILTLLRINQTGSLPDDVGLLPKIDICVLELPGQMPLVQLDKGDCELKNTLNEINFNLIKTHHHIRHQKHLQNEQQQHQQQLLQQQQSQDGSPSTSQNNSNDIRSKIINKTIIMTKDVLEKLNNASINR